MKGSTTRNPKLQGLIEELEGEFSTFRLIPKERSPVMWTIYYGLLMFLWCPTFMTSYTTVLITRIYMPSDLIGTSRSYATLRHERVHMRDCMRTGILPFALSYLFLLPAVLTCRAVWEMRAYAESMRVELEQTGSVSDSTVRHVARQLTSSSYLWMFPFPKLAHRWVERVRRRVLAEKSSREF